MSKKRACVGALVCILFAMGLWDDAPSQPIGRQAKSLAAQNEAPVRLSAPSAEAFNSAALRNSELVENLKWNFGGKPQRGLQLYLPLISDMIGADADARSNRFASALSAWQLSNGLEPDGILDGDTRYRMISTFQARRIKDRSPPPEDHLVTVPASDFYDPTRAEELRKVERQTYIAYKRMAQAAASDTSLGLLSSVGGELSEEEKYFKIISAYRSREYQDQLRKQSPRSGRAGLAVNSPHFTGRALDIYVGGEPVSTKDENRELQISTPVYRWLVKNAARFGFRPYFYEPWHWEYIRKD